ncbi:MAG: hypothetical protein PHE58_04905, partial [Candidatus Omnitrophica bacterium]|nr:hypothetical protein [Candidatus Omnitrophota bacterium]
MKRVFLGILAFVFFSITTFAQALTIDWASSVANLNAFNAESALGKPDGQTAIFGNGSGIART